jgi:hypothetical protein
MRERKPKLIAQNPAHATERPAFVRRPNISIDVIISAIRAMFAPA